MGARLISSGLCKEAASLEFAIFPELSYFSVGVSWTGPPVHLAVDPDPLVCDPLGPDQDRTTPVLYQVIIAAILVHVPPQHYTSLFGPGSWFLLRCCMLNANIFN